MVTVRVPQKWHTSAAVERFVGIFKRERVNRVRNRISDEARAALFEYIGVFYNRNRRHARPERAAEQPTDRGEPKDHPWISGSEECFGAD